MILNLPDKINAIKFLDAFYIGDTEAKNDGLLGHRAVVCVNGPIREFLQNKKSIIIGERGAGKTALFQLISKGQLTFTKHENHRQIILPIEEEFEYGSIKDLVTSIIASQTTDVAFRYRIIWEMYLFYRILKKLREVFKEDLPTEMYSIADQIDKIFTGSEPPKGLMSFIKSLKYSIGMKVDNSYGTLKATPYASIEPQTQINPNNEHASDEVKKMEIDLDSYKTELQRFLYSKNTSIIVAIDKLDEFVFLDKYKSQKYVLNGLANCERNYLQYQNIKLKIFMRKDLFEKLDFETLGYDKVTSRTVELRWTDTDIRELISKRIAYNLHQFFKLEYFQFDFDQERLYLDDKRFNEFQKIKAEISKNKTLFVIISLIWRIIPFKNRNYFDKRTERKKSFTDEINSEFITVLFPRNCEHRNATGEKENIDIFVFLKSHFLLGSGNTNPRIMLMFLEECIKISKDYYRQNPDEVLLSIDNQKEYPLFKRESLRSSFVSFQERLHATFSKISSKWEKWFRALTDGLSAKYSFSHKDIQRLLPASPQEELKQFLAFLCHIGFLTCSNKRQALELRKYEIPIVFQALKDD